jgi:hypothetical protein
MKEMSYDDLTGMDGHLPVAVNAYAISINYFLSLSSG